MVPSASVFFHNTVLLIKKQENYWNLPVALHLKRRQYPSWFSQVKHLILLKSIFSERDNFECDQSFFYHWYRNRNTIDGVAGTRKQSSDGGQENMENMMADEIINLWLESFIADGAWKIESNRELD